MHLLASEIFGDLRMRDMTCMNRTGDPFSTSNLMEVPEIFG